MKDNHSKSIYYSRHKPHHNHAKHDRKGKNIKHYSNNDATTFKHDNTAFRNNKVNNIEDNLAPTNQSMFSKAPSWVYAAAVAIGSSAVTFFAVQQFIGGAPIGPTGTNAHTSNNIGNHISTRTGKHTDRNHSKSSESSE